ncbi:hypothetical protein LX15_001464 [Streptoalloteichus tenebrarius]|uniref:DUF6879 domain-containing protein n=1 Tax=Streptoalloteichus tenebrarius (strain ATCC 17920 / DSM 40477 / JCM 4838 / CBS 697.72 / NBRC 16177 / NCIMB 11028 / NRRL B-12390 / A12253. 1 / ISP 5477) TaxID=1933 RepID=A0ABT1HQI7_STRSD|nr:DUF6879 family protein [Streptoalloteichus tenebrarius]MCP2257778.1 hypothetical protein [Streptoalloteichus tenebrarius]BFE99862.1 hypothetical protein GCM10020241_15380 [Streptoalloteichus tenebrarius]
MFLDGDVWQAYFRDFRKSAFRLETHQVYTMPAEAEDLQRFLAGEPMPEAHNSPWHQTIRNNISAGKTMTRVKIIRRPLTDYTRFLLSWCIPDNVAAGEQYRIIDVTEREVDLPEQDFWLFDDETVVRLNYRPDGTQINRELVESGDITQYLRWRDLALAESVPFAEYQAEVADAPGGQ